MEYLLPHITRINNFCNTLEYGQKTYLHISSNHSREEYQEFERHRLSNSSLLRLHSHTETRMDARKNSDDGSNDADDESVSEYPANNDIDLQGQLRRYNEIMKDKTKTLPVSVIVTDRSGSTSSSVPSPTFSSTTDGSNDGSKHGDDRMELNGRGKAYMYKPAPMVRKSERRFITADKKDSLYWERRKRNNAAAKKSRESRREKEIEVNKRCELLKKENEGMKFTILNLQERNIQLENTTKLYKEILIKNNLL